MIHTGRRFALREEQYHRMVRVGRDLKDHLVPTPLTFSLLAFFTD